MRNSNNRGDASEYFTPLRRTATENNKVRNKVTCKHTGKLTNSLTKKADQQLLATNLLPHASPNYRRKVIDIAFLLRKAAKRLEAVKREQYEMQLRAKFEFC